MTKNNGRVLWLDNLKAFGIILVVLGHAPSIDGYFANFIYSFHMPLFFFAAGCTYKKKTLKLHFNSLITNLFLPYVFFLVISYVYWLVANDYSPIKIHLHDIINAFLFGSSIDNNFYFNPPMWFFSALISLKVLAIIVEKTFKDNRLIVSFIVSVTAITVLNNSEMRLPQGVDIALTSLFFYFIGEWVFDNNSFVFSENWKNYLVTLLCFALVLLLSLINGRVDVNTLNFSNEAIYLVNAIIGILMVFYLSQICGEVRTFNYIAKNTIWYFPLHGFVFALFTLVLIKVFDIDKSIKDDNLLFSVIYTIGAFLVISACVKIKNKIGFRYF
ncbi:hypothetical protein EGH82_14135 [Vibrio ponticus]|uniref:Acyltransferase 3 domain-containing protein n=1 Tax=Vibrio ponticus TaxID=265668 RepID=A0A3N3DXX8_9VIBR|nr:acyltransferase family protein [Vibrio ponticus]ROV59381.1 hypothetical protein EGH82_14135 [Vibrio ponticus]